MNLNANMGFSPARLEVSNDDFIGLLKRTVGAKHVISDDVSTMRYRTGFRFGKGPALAVVLPGSLVEMWRVLNLCAQAGKIIIMQAANTGLTGGSTPDGDTYDRDIVIINTLRLATIHLIKDAEQVICLPGATLYQLEKALKPFGREPHSVIGSSCIGASVLGGICNNSGGSLIHRGPAFTQMTLYAQIDEAGAVRLINHLGIELGGDPEGILEKIETGDFSATDVTDDPDRHCSDPDYLTHVRQIELSTPARFNADPKRLFESAGSAGKIMLLAVRLDTFPKEAVTADFYLGTNTPDVLTEIRRHILSEFNELPVQGEYIHRDAFDIAETYGKDTFLAVQYLGTDRLPAMFALKARFDAFASRLRFLPRDLSDKLMQFASTLFPKHLPKRMYEYRQNFEHHLMLRMSGRGIDEARTYLAELFRYKEGAYFECTPEEGTKAFLHRFAAASAANRYRAVHRKEVEEIVALDIALPRNELAWFETLPRDITAKLVNSLYYGHFFCQVFHQDYIVKKGFDPIKIEHDMWKILDERGAEYPAEHNVGHLYNAKPTLVAHYKCLDPSNAFNPGIGHTSKCAHWR